VNTLLHVKAKVVQANGADLAADAAVSLVNLFLHSLFSQVDISLNGTLITSLTNTYPYRAMTETLLSYGHDTKTSQLTSVKDMSGNMDSLDFDNVANINWGVEQRHSLTRESRVVDMMGRLLHADIFFHERYVVNEVNTRIKLVRSKDAFCLMGNAHFKVQIMHASLFVQKAKLMPSIFLANAKALEHGTAKCAIQRVVCKSLKNVKHEKLFSGQLPTRIVIGLVDNRAFNGNQARNPLNFKHFDLSEIAVYLDGQQQHAIRPIQLNFADGQYIRAYNMVFAGTGKLGANEGLFIDRIDYATGYALYAFNLTANLGEDDHFSLLKQGNVHLTLKFANSLTTTVTVIAYAEFQNVIEIDRVRDVVFDLGV